MFVRFENFVEKAFMKKFRKDFVEKVKLLKPVIRLRIIQISGAIVSKQHFEKYYIILMLRLLKAEKILCGGRNIKGTGRCENGWFIEPTVIEGLSFDCRTNQEEIFGPVVTITPFFETEEEVLMMV